MKNAKLMPMLPIYSIVVLYFYQGWLKVEFMDQKLKMSLQSKSEVKRGCQIKKITILGEHYL